MNAAAIEQRLENIERMLSQLTAAFSVQTRQPSPGDDLLAVIATQGAQAGVAFCKSKMKETKRRAA